MSNYYTIGILHGIRGPFTYKVPKSLEFSEGDHAIVYNARGFAVGEVIEVHDEPQDYDPNITYRWAFQKVDKDALMELDNE